MNKILLTIFPTFILSLAIVTNAQPKTFTDAEREQATKDFIKGYTGQNIAKGDELRNQQQHIGAIANYTKALLVDPHNVDALFGRATTYILAGQYFRANKDLAIAVKYNPENFWANVQHGFVLLQLGYADDAFPYLKKAMSLPSASSNRVVPFYTLQAAMFMGNYQQCVENYDIYFKSTKAEVTNYWQDEDLNTATHIAAECHLRLGNRAEAQKVLKDASSGSFRYFEYWHSNMISGADLTCRVDANKSAEKAVKLFRKARESYENKKPEKDWNKQYLEAFIEIQNGLLCDPNNISLLQTRTEFAATTIQPKHYYRVYYRQLERQLEKTKNPNADQILAKLTFKSMFQDNPRYIGMDTITDQYKSNGKFVGGDLVNLYALDEKFTNADLAIKAAEKLFEDYLPRQDATTRLIYLNAALELEPNNAEALALRARTFFNSQSQYLQPLAWRDATAALKINPKLVSPYTVRGAILRGENTLSAALVEINKGLAINPNDPKALLNRGLAQISLGNKDAGFRDLNQIIELLPENGWYYAARAGAYNADGQTAKAIADYQKASKLSPPYGTRDQNSDIELIKLYDKTGEKALADALHKQFYEKFRSSIINNLIPNYETIANRNPVIVAQIEVEIKQYYRNEDAKQKTGEANKRNAAIAAYNNTVDEGNRLMGYYNSKVEQGNRQTTQAARVLVDTWNSAKTAKAVAEMRVLLQNLLRDHGAYLPLEMKEQIEAQLKSLK